jgi:hypothetical protein
LGQTPIRARLEMSAPAAQQLLLKLPLQFTPDVALS